MDICIVGHGPSLLNAGLGDEIDKQSVCRLKGFKHDPKDYGYRTDYVCASAEAAGTLDKNISAWVYPKLGRLSRNPGFGLFPLEICEKWNDEFKRRVNYSGNGPLGRNVGTGLAACIIAMEVYEPETLVLAGFDTVLHPETRYQSVFNPGTHHDQFHYWKVEHELLFEVAAQKGVSICELSPVSGRTAIENTVRNS